VFVALLAEVVVINLGRWPVLAAVAIALMLGATMLGRPPSSGPATRFITQST
jgi:hypothetical protein